MRIEKNPALCFVETIDWSIITSGSKENVFSNNKAVNECPTCPNGMTNEKNMNSGSQNICPEIAEKKRVCWNRSECQHSKLQHTFFSSTLCVHLILNA